MMYMHMLHELKTLRDMQKNLMVYICNQHLLLKSILILINIIIYISPICIQEMKILI